MHGCFCCLLCLRREEESSWGGGGVLVGLMVVNIYWGHRVHFLGSYSFLPFHFGWLDTSLPLYTSFYVEIYISFGYKKYHCLSGGLVSDTFTHLPVLYIIHNSPASQNQKEYLYKYLLLRPCMIIWFKISILILNIFCFLGIFNYIWDVWRHTSVNLNLLNFIKLAFGNLLIVIGY